MNAKLFSVVAIVALVVGIWGYQTYRSNQLALPDNALYYKKSRDLKPFVFMDHYGNTFTQENVKGKWSWFFLGYMSCPDVCPTTLQTLNFIYVDLKKVSNNTQVLLVSADPQRDTVANLANYIAYFNKEFIALRAEHDVLFPFTRNLGLMYAINDDETKLSYLVDHSASMVLINPEGKIAAIFKPKQEVGELSVIDGELLVSDFAKIVALYNSQHK